MLLVAYNTAARRSDLLRLVWGDVDLEGVSHESGKFGPSIRIANTKSNRRKAIKKRLDIPLYASTVEVLKDLRANPAVLCHPQALPQDRAVRVKDGQAVETEHVFPVRGYRQPKCKVSQVFAEFCQKAGLTDAKGSNRWVLHDIRRKANDDIQQAGGSLREQMALTGHRSPQVNVMHYPSADPDRMRRLVADMSGFRGLRIVRESA